MTVERWAPVPRFPGYEVSTLGAIRSLKRSKPVLMKQETDKDGYKRVQLFRSGEYHHLVVSRIVAYAFLGQAPEGKPYCCHIDGSRDNNAAGNLRWDSQKENIADKVRHGTAQVGSKHPRATLTEDTVAAIKLRLGKASAQSIASEFNVTRHVVNDIKRGRTWVHV